MAMVSCISSQPLLAPSPFLGRCLSSSPSPSPSPSAFPCLRLRSSFPSIRAETQSKGPSLEHGGQWLSSTTRHIRIYAGYIDPVTKKMDQSQLDKLSLILDPDDEFLWPDDKSQKVFDYFTELVDNYAGADLTEYTLRLIGSDLEHFIRKMLLSGELKYNLDCRVLNFSMGKPRFNIEEEEGEAVA